MASFYKIPVSDHKYRIRKGTWDRNGSKSASSGYMSELIRQAKQRIDPQKYASQQDWNKSSKLVFGGVFPKAKKLTFTDQII